MNFYKLSVCVVAYNQKKYIKKTLDSLLMQKTNFFYQILISDDASTDGTADIIYDYSIRFPSIIKPVFNKINIGPFLNSINTYKRADTEYVAICDGDDYFTDPLKLQKQVDFLDKNLNCSICFHPVLVKWEDNSKKDSFYPSEKIWKSRRFYTIEDLLNYNFIQTNSVMYRWLFNKKNFLKFYKQELAPGDYFLHLLHAKFGDIGFIEEVMAVYRRNPGGIWINAELSLEWYFRCGIPSIRFLLEVHRLFFKDCSKKINELATLTEISMKLLGDSSKLSELYKLVPKILPKPKFLLVRYYFLLLIKFFVFGRLRFFVKQRISFLKKIIFVCSQKVKRY